ncbi:hypothetical protein [Nocardiopsis suaedae]|uniref:Ig-like domain-containing protein n=1 Tax=Nocardiopsis suaedae TaxID=3018444 RepID=A0ABT4TT25_9ACTN|nr:hypothetical protein [Nocardiopsis suaedae]MDA2807848.1 hypothetical protein [Nocardiopsis suaedae]
MSHPTTRLTTGFAVFAVAALSAGPVLADDAPPFDYDAELAYTCSSDRGHEEGVTLHWYIEATPDGGEARVGGTLEHGAVVDGLTYWVGYPGTPVTSLTYTLQVLTEGEAAEQDAEHFESTWSGSALKPFEEADGWDDRLFQERELTRAGPVSYRPGEVVVTAEQEDGVEATTTCTPDEASPPVLAEVSVLEEDGGGDGGDAGDGAEGGAGAEPVSGGGDQADGRGGPGGLPVSGAVLGGAAAAAAAATAIGGGAAVYLSRRKNTGSDPAA